MVKKSEEYVKTDKKSVEVKKINILALAKISGIILATIGLVMVFLLYLGLTFSTDVEMAANFNHPLIAQFGYFSIIIFPIVFGIQGFVSGAVIAFLYNMFAEKIGGIKVELH